ncbi:metal ABC transporter permease, partial [Bifidobacteriaceae bacterium NR003]
MLETATQFIDNYGDLLIEGVQDTLVMTSVATLLAYAIGLPIGVL